MAATRKLQGEIERCLKKVTEGVETFEDIWQKVHNATNSNQKEKYEADLKKEIKKLQRLRDQIKSWIASGEIKDKSTLLDYRKLIETQMERFKVVERETKTKAYSKEGLGAAQKMDPAQKEREEVSTWLVNSIDSLNQQLDQFESEIESLLAGKKKRLDKEKQDRLDELKSKLERHRYHIRKLETLLRMLDNMSVEVSQIKGIKDNVEYYIECSQEPGFEESEYIYDEIIGLDEIELSGVGLPSSATTDSNGGSPTSMTLSPAPSPPPPPPPPLGGGALPQPSPLATLQQHHHHSASSTTNTTHHHHNQNDYSDVSGSAAISAANTNTITTLMNNSSSSSSTGDEKSGGIVAASTTAVSKKKKESSGVSSAGEQIQTKNVVKPTAVRATSALLNSSSGGSALTSVNNSTGVVKNNNSSQNNSGVVGLLGGGAATSPNNLVVANNNNNNKLHQQQQQQQQQTPNNSSPSSGGGHHNHHPHHGGGGAPPSSLHHNAAAHAQQSNFAAVAAAVANAAAVAAASQQGLSNKIGAHATENGGILPGGLSSLVSHQQQQHDSNSNNSSLLHNNTSSNNNNNNSVVVNNSNNSSSSPPSSSSVSSAESPAPPPMAASTPPPLPPQQQQQQSAAALAAAAAAAAAAADQAAKVAALKCMAQQVLDRTTGLDMLAGADPSRGLFDSSSGGNSGKKLQQQQQQQHGGTTSEAHIPPLLGVAPLGPVPLQKEHQCQFQMMESAYYHMPHPADSERVRQYLARSPCPTPPYYNQVPLAHSDTLEFFQRLSTETLFFIFYYMEGSKAQYMAAKALKKQSWRFHTKYMMWFQRHEEPKLINEEYEQGTYIYFDYEKWGQRKKECFTFEYKYLEDRDLN